MNLYQHTDIDKNYPANKRVGSPMREKAFRKPGLKELRKLDRAAWVARQRKKRPVVDRREGIVTED